MVSGLVVSGMQNLHGRHYAITDRPRARLFPLIKHLLIRSEQSLQFSNQGQPLPASRLDFDRQSACFLLV